MDPLRLGLIGCGRAAERLHVPALRRVTAFRLVAVADPSRDRRDLVAESTGARAFEDAEQLLAGAAVDALLVATPPEAHARPVEAALRARVPVLVEKPLAASAGEGESLARLAGETGTPLLVAFNRRHLAAVTALRRILERRDARPLELASELHALPATWDAIAGAREPLSDLASHHLDLFRFLARAEIESISAIERIGGTELVAALSGGSVARCVVSQGVTSRERLGVRVRSAANAAWEIRSTSSLLRPTGGPVRVVLDRASAVLRRALGRPDPLARSYERQLLAFARTVRGGGVAVASAGAGLAVLYALEAAHESLRCGGDAVPVRTHAPPSSAPPPSSIQLGSTQHEGRHAAQ